MAKHTITLIPGDGIGPEITSAMTRVVDATGVDIEDRLIGAIDRAMDAQRRIDHFFWLLVAADIVGEQSTKRVRDLLRIAARRIHTNRRVPHRGRLAAVQFLFAKAVPVD